MPLDEDAMAARVRDLTRKCAESYEHGLALPVPDLNPNEKFNVQFLGSLFTRVSVPEIIATLQASEIRARAMALARAGEKDQARRVLDIAKSVCARASLSAEATAATCSFQNAAEAFLWYRTQDYDKAELSLRAALECCRTLRDQYHYAVDVRRIELARNLVRVKSSAGRREDAFHSACLLVRYVEGETECWPFRDLQLATENDQLASEDRFILLDQILSEISSLLAADGSKGLLLKLADRELFTGHAGMGSRVSRARLRLGAMRAAAEDDVIGFLENATAFFRDGPGYMPRAWQEMSREYLKMCGQAASEALPIEE